MNTRIIKLSIVASMCLFPLAQSLHAAQADGGDEPTASDVAAQEPLAPQIPSSDTGARPADEFDALPQGFGGGFSQSFAGGLPLPNQRQVAGRQVMITWSEQNDELRGFSITRGEWETLKIAKQDVVVPVVSDSVAAVRVGDSMAAFSGDKGCWDLIPLTVGSQAVPVVSDDLVQTQDNGHLYTFAAAKGRWTSPTDPELRSRKVTVATQSSGLAVKRAFEEWFDSLPQYKARGISMMDSRGLMSSRGAVTVEADRQSLLNEAVEILKNLPESPSLSLKVGVREAAGDTQDLEARIASLRAELQSLEQTASRASGDAGKNSPADDTEKQALRKTVERAFDLRQQMQQLEAERIRLKLRLVEANLETRQKNRDRIVERRVEELLDPNGEAGELKLGANDKSVTGSSIGLSGPPQSSIRYGTSGTPSQVLDRAAATAPSSAQGMIAAMKWSQPSEVVKLLRQYRDEMNVRVRDLKRPQEAVEQYSRPLSELIAEGIAGEDSNEQWREKIQKSSQEDLNHYERLRKDTDRDWLHAWAEYQSLLRLLQLDVETAQASIAPVQQNFDRVRQLSRKGAASYNDLQQAGSQLKLAQIQVRRAEELLQLYADIEKNEPQLNPDYKAPAAEEETARGQE